MHTCMNVDTHMHHTFTAPSTVVVLYLVKAAIKPVISYSVAKEDVEYFKPSVN